MDRVPRPPIRIPQAPHRRAFALLLVFLLVAPVHSVVAYDPATDGALQPGTIERQPANRTVVSTQGLHFAGHYDVARPPRLVSVTPNGSLAWQYHGRRGVTQWFYDVDPLPNGNLLVVSPRGESTLVYELDRQTRRRVWTERLPFRDTHDVDRLDDGRLVVANMRSYDASTGRSRDRVVVWNRSRDAVTWEWSFAAHFPASTADGMDGDWTHVNDVDPVGEDRLLVSPRNFDQVLLIDRTTKEIALRLGADDRTEILHAQHNPDYLRGENGTPTLLVANSEADEVVEYARRDGEWTRTWALRSNLTWPRDADRLPNGNTLVVDSLGHRVVEVTPRGRVVWEYYATWAPYDAERLGTGDGSSGPTMRERNVTGTYRVHGGAGLSPATRRDTPHAWLDRVTDGTPAERPAQRLAAWYAHRAPWYRPVWLSPWAFLSALGALAVALGWGGVEAYLRWGDAVADRVGEWTRGA
ncbi:MAG: aryl-sulfate sulfotransferase [Haloferacaceae archaeon]